jgi:hypothetical protein
MSTIVVKPAEGLLVRNPDRGFRPLEAAGEAVPLTEYWLRRLRDGDVVRVAPETKPKTSK